jgi:calcium-dependent protein kinase
MHSGDRQVHDNYEFFGSIGHGSFGDVMIARQKHTRQLRACKVVTVRTEKQLQLARTEVELLQTLDHPNILKLHEAYLDKSSSHAGTKIYMVTELCEGGDLRSRISYHYEELKQPMSESHAAFMMQQILSALHCCHARGIVHRDIKPENILFMDRSPKSPVKIIDFGLADFTERIRARAEEVEVPREDMMGRLVRTLPQLTKRSSRLRFTSKRVMQRAGTAPYMAPEVDQGLYNESADMFSVGIILCQMLSGRHPFKVSQNESRKSIRLKITAPFPVEFAADTFGHVSSEAQDLCREFLEKNPKKRLNAARALAHPWFSDPSKQLPYGNPSSTSACEIIQRESIFDAICEYQTSHRLKRAVLQLLAREVPEDQLKGLSNQFMALDTNGDGRLSVNELARGLQSGTADLEQVLSTLSDGQQIPYAEFIAALAWHHVDFDRDHFWSCFQKLDRSNRGCITYADMCAALRVDSADEPAFSESEWEDITVAVGSGGMHDRLEVTFERLLALLNT